MDDKYVIICSDSDVNIKEKNGNNLILKSKKKITVIDSVEIESNAPKYKKTKAKYYYVKCNEGAPNKLYLHNDNSITEKYLLEIIGQKSDKFNAKLTEDDVLHLNANKDNVYKLSKNLLPDYITDILYSIGEIAIFLLLIIGVFQKNTNQTTFCIYLLAITIIASIVDYFVPKNCKIYMFIIYIFFGSFLSLVMNNVFSNMNTNQSTMWMNFLSLVMIVKSAIYELILCLKKDKKIYDLWNCKKKKASTVPVITWKEESNDTRLMKFIKRKIFNRRKAII